jgi:methionyl-tRNA formyltransferase
VRIVYLGTSPFAAAVLGALAETPHRPALVVTRPDRPRGRGRRLAAPPVAETARRLGLALIQPPDVGAESARAEIAAARPEALVVCAFGALIKEPLLSDHDVLNVHPSLLPRWRGAAPIERAIMAGDPRTGVSIMRLTAGLVTGPVALAGSEPITASDTFGTLAGRLESLGAALLLRALDAGPGGLTFHEQDESGVTYAEKISAADRILDGAVETADALARRVRALTPHVGAAVRLSDGERLGVLEVRARAAVAGDPPPGELGVTGGHPLLGAARQSTLELREVRPASGRPMDGAAYLRGRRPTRR